MEGVIGGEAPQIRLSGIDAPSTGRRRPTERAREAARLSDVLAISLGQTVRTARTGLQLTQAELGRRVGVHQGWISRIELGQGHGVPLERWVALGVALKRPLAISFSRSMAGAREPGDAGHLGMQERLLELARRTGRPATFELPTRSADPRHSIDVCLRDARHRVLILQEAWNTFGDLGAAVRSTNRKAAEAADLAEHVDDGAPYRVATVWAVRSTAANRSLVARYPHIFRTALPGSSRLWARALATGAAPPEKAGLVWLDAAIGSITEWRRPPV